MMVRVDSAANGANDKFGLRCPSCRREATLEPVNNLPDLHLYGNEEGLRLLAVRRCPNDECHGLVVLVADGDRDVLSSWPPETIDFDTDDLPEAVLDAFREAVLCQAAGCHRAAAMMARRTLEVLCDERGAKGKNLEERIDQLRDKVILPPALFDALHDLRYLGNDAAHVTLKAYDDVGSAEAEAALLLVKEVLKALYQMDAIAKALGALKKAT